MSFAAAELIDRRKVQEESGIVRRRCEVAHAEKRRMTLAMTGNNVRNVEFNGLEYDTYREEQQR
jgi:hypothetical protein